MNKIIIDPHYCSKEEYQALKDYLTEKTWDWQEVSSGNKEDIGTQEEIGETIEVLQHTIAYSYQDWDGKPDECDIEHLEKMISEGYNQGELNTSMEEHRGWWRIVIKM